MKWLIRLIGCSGLPVGYTFAWLSDDHVLTNGIALGAAYGYVLLVFVFLLIYIHNG